MKCRLRASCRAYTLVEVLIVVTILGISGAVVVPHLLDPSSISVQGAARAVIADLLYAQNEAIAQQAPRRLVFDTDAERYWLEERAVNGAWTRVSLNWRTGSGDDLIDFEKDSRFSGITLATVQTDTDGNVTGFTGEGGQFSVAYDELGTPRNGAAVGVRAENHDFVVFVAPFTGRVTVEEVELPE